MQQLLNQDLCHDELCNIVEVIYRIKVIIYQRYDMLFQRFNMLYHHKSYSKVSSLLYVQAASTLAGRADQYVIICCIIGLICCIIDLIYCITTKAIQKVFRPGRQLCSRELTNPSFLRS